MKAIRRFLANIRHRVEMARQRKRMRDLSSF